MTVSQHIRRIRDLERLAASDPIYFSHAYTKALNHAQAHGITFIYGPSPEEPHPVKTGGEERDQTENAAVREQVKERQRIKANFRQARTASEIKGGL